MPRLGEETTLRVTSQAYKAYKKIVRFVCSNGLKPGEKLPPQQELCRRFATNNDTLSAAMQALVQQGVLRRKSKVGTTVADMAALPPVAWSAGIATLPAPFQGPSSYNALLAFGLQAELSRRGCRCICYYRYQPEVPARLSSFQHLAGDLEEGDLDGIAVLTRLAESDQAGLRQLEVPAVCFSSGEYPCGVRIDRDQSARRAAKELLKLGCRSLGMVYRDAQAGAAEDRAWIGVCEELAAAGMPAVAGRRILALPGVEEGRRTAAGLLAALPHERPDGLIVFDDYTALGLCEVLRARGGYAPRLAVQTNKQLPLAFALLALRFEVDLDAVIRRSSDLLWERLYNPALPDRIEWMELEQSGDSEGQTSTSGKP
ncbi:MAG: GntR family transcriptional regulator [Planctomycetes bacterium]|nr:GntR family transcriptional regulator [Planctomycetota bacterium]